MTYNTTFMNNVTNLGDMALGVSGALGNEYLIGNLMLLSFAIVFIIISKREDLLNVMIANSLLTTILAILLFTINMVAAYMIVVPFLLFIILIVFRLMT